jgi:hypothetical protein
MPPDALLLLASAPMECHACGKPVAPEQRFCGTCGAPLRGVTDPTSALPTAASGTDAGERWDALDPEWAATGRVPVTAAPPSSPGVTASLPATEPIPATSTGSPLDAVPDAVPVDTDEVWAIASEAYSSSNTGWVAERTVAAPHTAEMPAMPIPVAPPQPRFRFGLVTLAAFVTALVALVGSFTTAVSVDSDQRLVLTDKTPPAFRTGRWLVDDLAGNMSIAVLVAALLIVVGGIAAGFHWRWGAGLAGGAGLAIAGLGALAVGLAQFPIDAARQFAAIPSAVPFTLTITKDLGYWLFVVAAALGLIVFFASLADAFGDRRPGLNPWIAALGALATVVAVIGPLLPEGVAKFSDNWYLIEGFGQPSGVLVAGRMAQIALLLVSGVVGYLSVRRWGLGLAIGGSLPVVWLAISTLFELTDQPVGPGYRNPGAASSDLHGVTIIGASAIVAMAILAVVAAYDQAARERR